MKPTAPHIDRCLSCPLSDCDEDDHRCPYMRPYRDKNKLQTILYLSRHPGLKKQMDKKYYKINREKILAQKKEYYRKNRNRILKKKRLDLVTLKEENKNLKICILLMLLTGHSRKMRIISDTII